MVLALGARPQVWKMKNTHIYPCLGEEARARKQESRKILFLKTPIFTHVSTLCHCEVRSNRTKNSGLAKFAIATLPLAMTQFFYLKTPINTHVSPKSSLRGTKQSLKLYRANILCRDCFVPRNDGIFKNEKHP
jgi:hypothetical protein